MKSVTYEVGYQVRTRVMGGCGYLIRAQVRNQILAQVRSLSVWNHVIGEIYNRLKYEIK